MQALAALALAVALPASAAGDEEPGVLNTQWIRVHSTLPPFGFRLLGSEGSVDGVELRVPGAAPVHLEWPEDQDATEPASPPGSLPALHTEDLNFDGYQDLLLVTWAGATGNVGYAVWIYEPERRGFVASRELWGQSNPRPHPERREITTFMKGGHAGMICDSDTFRWIEGRPVVVRNVKQDWSEERGAYLKTISERTDGRLAVVRTLELRPGDDAGELQPCDWP